MKRGFCHDVSLIILADNIYQNRKEDADPLIQHSLFHLSPLVPQSSPPSSLFSSTPCLFFPQPSQAPYPLSSASSPLFRNLLQPPHFSLLPQALSFLNLLQPSPLFSTSSFFCPQPSPAPSPLPAFFIFPLQSL